MNDFTKEELEMIWDGLYILDGFMEERGGISEFSKEILNKIQSLIDNYCEHEWESQYNCIHEVCTKCEKIKNE